MNTLVLEQFAEQFQSGSLVREIEGLDKLDGFE